MDERHVCDATINPCTCGHRWEYQRRWSNGSVTFTSAEVKARFEALYGNTHGFEPAEARS